MAVSFNLIDKSKNYLLKFSKDPGGMLLWTATIGWVLSASGQILGIAANKKTSKKEKRFLVPQEIADAAINILSFFILTYKFQNWTKSLVSKGKIITPKIKNVCLKYGIKFEKESKDDVINIGKALNEKINGYKSLIEINKNEDKLNINLSPEQIKTVQNKIKELTHFKDETYSPFESGLKVTGNLVGGIIAGNIITPMLRNPIAAYKQKTAMENEKLEHDAKLYNDNKAYLTQIDTKNQNRTFPQRTVPNVFSNMGTLKI